MAEATVEKIIVTTSIFGAVAMAVIVFRFLTPVVPDLISASIAFSVLVSIVSFITAFMFPSFQEKVLGFISSVVTFVFSFLTFRAVTEKYQISFDNIKQTLQEAERDIILPASQHIEPLFGGVADPNFVPDMVLILFGSTCVNVLITVIGIMTTFYALDNNIIGPTHPEQMPTTWTYLNDCKVAIFGGDLNEPCKVPN